MHELPFVINNSGGRTSAFMTEELLRDEFIRNNCIVSFQNTGKENDQTLDFIHNCEERWKRIYGIDLVWLEYTRTNEQKFRIVDFKTAHRTADEGKPSPFEELLKPLRYVPNVVNRICTTELKVRTVKRYIMSLGYKHWTHVTGIRYDEPARWNKGKNMASKQRWEVWMPLVEWKITKPDVLNFWSKMDFDLQLRDYEGNCDLCFLKGINKRLRIIKEDPSKADWWIRMEKEKGGTFRLGYGFRDLVAKIKSQPELPFYETDFDFECFCNID